MLGKMHTCAVSVYQAIKKEPGYEANEQPTQTHLHYLIRGVGTGGGVGWLAPQLAEFEGPPPPKLGSVDFQLLCKCMGMLKHDFCTLLRKMNFNI